MAGGFDVLMKVEGGEQLRRALLRQEQRFVDEMAKALPEEAAALMASANAVAPRKSGTLAASSVVSSVAQRKRGSVKAAAAYTDEKAAAVHEGVHWGAHVEGTRGFKWFERALNAFEPGFLERIAGRLKRIVGGGT